MTAQPQPARTSNSSNEEFDVELPSSVARSKYVRGAADSVLHGVTLLMGPGRVHAGSRSHYYIALAGVSEDSAHVWA